MVRICLLSQRWPYMASFSSMSFRSVEPSRRNARKQAAGARPRKNFRHKQSIGLRCNVTTYRTGRGRSFGANREFAGHETLHAAAAYWL